MSLFKTLIKSSVINIFYKTNFQENRIDMGKFRYCLRLSSPKTIPQNKVLNIDSLLEINQFMGDKRAIKGENEKKQNLRMRELFRTRS